VVFTASAEVYLMSFLLQAIWLELSDAVHAVDAMTTKTPQEAAN
jgi:hypothetical protein